VPNEVDRAWLVLNDARWTVLLTITGTAGALCAVVILIALWISHIGIARAVKAVCVIESAVDDEVMQGTGFYLAGVGLITCAHVLRATSFLNEDSSAVNRVPFKVIVKDEDSDIAIIAVDVTPKGELAPNTSKPRVGQRVTVVGFPKHDSNASGTRLPVRVIAHRQRFGRMRYVVDKQIVAGTSGGPILDWRGKVIGIADCGVSSRREIGDAESTFIPIAEVYELLKRHSG